MNSVVSWRDLLSEMVCLLVEDVERPRMPDTSRLDAVGMKLDSSPRQLTNGTIIFYDKSVQRRFFFYTDGPEADFLVRSFGIDQPYCKGTQNSRAKNVTWDEAVSLALTNRENFLKKLQPPKQRGVQIEALLFSASDSERASLLRGLIDLYPVYDYKGVKMTQDNVMEKIINGFRSFFIDVPKDDWSAFTEAMTYFQSDANYSQTLTVIVDAVRTPAGRICSVKQPKKLQSDDEVDTLRKSNKMT